MLEHAHHLIGSCGEPHPSFLSFILGSLGVTGFVIWIKYKYNQFISLFRKK